MTEIDRLRGSSDYYKEMSESCKSAARYLDLACDIQQLITNYEDITLYIETADRAVGTDDPAQRILIDNTDTARAVIQRLTMSLEALAAELSVGAWEYV